MQIAAIPVDELPASQRARQCERTLAALHQKVDDVSADETAAAYHQATGRLGFS
jgi:hypothetical protein